MPRLFALLSAIASLHSPLPAAPACDRARIDRLPLVERPADSDSNATLVVLMTGDGDWAHADEEVAKGLRARGGAVVGVKMRSYLGERRTPDEVADDMACVATFYLQAWHRQRLMLLGYSRGADLAPFVASRWSADLRERLNLVALVSLSSRANFHFHLIDLVKDVEREDDVLVGPEIAKLRGLRLVCIYGTEETNSGCRGADPSLMQAIARPGGHRLTGGFDAIADVLASGLKPASPPGT